MEDKFDLGLTTHGLLSSSMEDIVNETLNNPTAEDYLKKGLGPVTLAWVEFMKEIFDEDSLPINVKNLKKTRLLLRGEIPLNSDQVTLKMRLLPQERYLECIEYLFQKLREKLGEDYFY